MRKYDFWTRVFASPEGVEGGEGGAVGDATATEQEGAAPGVAGAAAEAPPSTFLSDAGKAKETEQKETAYGGEVEKPAEPAAFDLAELKLPEGFELSEDAGKAFAELLNDSTKTPQERAQAFMDMHTAALKQSVEAHTETVRANVVKENLDLWTKTNNEWREQIKTLPEFKENPDAEAGKIMQALTTIGADAKFFEAMNLTGAGNHPAILQVLHRLAKPFMEGGPVGGASGQQTRREPGANIYTSATKP